MLSPLFTKLEGGCQVDRQPCASISLSRERTERVALIDFFINLWDYTIGMG